MKSRPKQLLFQPPNLNFKRQALPNIEHPEQDEHFSSQDRENLKNAFRYIARLIFKEAIRYRQHIKQIADKIDYKFESQAQIDKLFERAEEISGQRYFRKYLSNYSEEQQKIICCYMIWFLQTKYLRYVGEDGKGKRKQMKKKLYIKFKNEIMIPYLQGCC